MRAADCKNLAESPEGDFRQAQKLPAARAGSFLQISQSIRLVVLDDLTCVQTVIARQYETDHTDEGKQMDIGAAKHLHA